MSANSHDFNIYGSGKKMFVSTMDCAIMLTSFTGWRWIFFVSYRFRRALWAKKGYIKDMNTNSRCISNPVTWVIRADASPGTWAKGAYACEWTNSSRSIRIWPWASSSITEIMSIVSGMSFGSKGHASENITMPDWNFRKMIRFSAPGTWSTGLYLSKITNQPRLMTSSEIDING